MSMDVDKTKELERLRTQLEQAQIACRKQSERADRAEKRLASVEHWMQNMSTWLDSLIESAKRLQEGIDRERN